MAQAGYELFKCLFNKDLFSLEREGVTPSLSEGTINQVALMRLVHWHLPVPGLRR